MEFSKTRLQISFTVPRGARELLSTDLSRDYSYFPSMKSYLKDRRGVDRPESERGRETWHREIGGGPWSETRGLEGSNFSGRAQRVAKTRRSRLFREKRPLCLLSLASDPYPRLFPFRLCYKICHKEDSMRT